MEELNVSQNSERIASEWFGIVTSEGCNPERNKVGPEVKFQTYETAEVGFCIFVLRDV